jgi:hypothetical protein
MQKQSKHWLVLMTVLTLGIFAFTIQASEIVDDQDYENTDVGLFGKYYLENVALNSQTISTSIENIDKGEVVLGPGLIIAPTAVVKMTGQQINFQAPLDIKSGSKVDIGIEPMAL